MSRYRDPQLQVAENYSDLFNLGTNICESFCFDTFNSQYQYFFRYLNRLKTTLVVISRKRVISVTLKLYFF